MARHTLELTQLGPVQKCTLSVEQFTVLTGPQSNGKSTIAKAVYFFRTVKQDILNIMMQGGPKSEAGHEGSAWEQILKQRMRNKFLQLFGTSWIMSDRMEMRYSYAKKFWLRVYLRPNKEDERKNFVDFEFSPDFQDYLRDLDCRSFVNVNAAQKACAEKELAQKLNDPYEAVFVPAGRNLITLLSTQLNYIFTSLEDTQLRNIDYVTKRYTELILKLKPMFKAGMNGLIQETTDDSDRLKRYRAHRPAINLLLKAAEKVLKGSYRCVEGEERLYLDEARYIKLNYISSGQQEIVWVFNLLFYYLLEGRKIFLILEEPESHLYPESQRTIGELLSLFQSEGNEVLVTTHSPYMLGTFNYLLLAGQVPPARQERLKKELHKRYWLRPADVSARHVRDGAAQDVLENEDGLVLINNGLIDGASQQINEVSDKIIDMLDDGEGM